MMHLSSYAVYKQMLEAVNTATLGRRTQDVGGIVSSMQTQRFPGGLKPPPDSLTELPTVS